MVRLQYGCPKYVGAQFRQADLIAVGVFPSHAKEVIRTLVKKGILIDNRQFNRYELIIGERSESEALYRLRRLVHRNSYRRGNKKITVTATPLLPKKEVKTYRNSNSEKLPKQELNRHSKHESHKAKDNEIKVNAGKRVKVAGEFIDLATFSPRDEKEVMAFETWQMLESENHSRLSFYLNLIDAGLSVDDFERIRTEVMADHDVSNRGQLFNRKAVECIKQRIAVRSQGNV